MKLFKSSANTEVQAWASHVLTFEESSLAASPSLLRLVAGGDMKARRTLARKALGLQLPSNIIIALLQDQSYLIRQETVMPIEIEGHSKPSIWRFRRFALTSYLNGHYRRCLVNDFNKYFPPGILQVIWPYMDQGQKISTLVCRGSGLEGSVDFYSATTAYKEWKKWFCGGEGRFFDTTTWETFDILRSNDFINKRQIVTAELAQRLIGTPDEYSIALALAPSVQPLWQPKEPARFNVVTAEAMQVLLSCEKSIVLQYCARRLDIPKWGYQILSTSPDSIVVDNWHQTQKLMAERVNEKRGQISGGQSKKIVVKRALGMKATKSAKTLGKYLSGLEK